MAFGRPWILLQAIHFLTFFFQPFQGLPPDGLRAQAEGLWLNQVEKGIFPIRERKKIAYTICAYLYRSTKQYKFWSLHLLQSIFPIWLYIIIPLTTPSLSAIENHAARKPAQGHYLIRMNCLFNRAIMWALHSEPYFIVWTWFKFECHCLQSIF